jgi:hypothetical protein
MADRNSVVLFDPGLRYSAEMLSVVPIIHCCTSAIAKHGDALSYSTVNNLYLGLGHYKATAPW